jgi:[acyl-carrier-protein] S-malonyltransferase
VIHLDTSTVKKKSVEYAVVFPGQGSQYTGMCQRFVKEFPSANDVFQVAEQMTSLPIKQLAFRGNADELRETAIAQPCLLAANVALYTVFRESFPSQEPSFVCGHSAGEYAALVASDTLPFPESVSLIQARGRLMSQVQKGGMVAIIGADLSYVEGLCKEAVVPDGTLVLANINSPNQVVISGDDSSIESIILMALDQDIKCVPLGVSGAFHSPFMKEAAAKFSEALSRVSFREASIPIVSNVTAQPIVDKEEWPALLEKHVSSTVFWNSSIRYIYQQGIKIFIEVGPGKILSKLICEIVPSAIVLNIEDSDSLHSTVSALKRLNSTEKAD